MGALIQIKVAGVHGTVGGRASGLDLRGIVQDHVEQGAVHFDAAIVADEAKLAEFIHEEAHPGPCRADHLGQGLLADFRDHRLGLLGLTKVRQQQEQPRKALLAGIEQLIDEVCFDPDVLS